MIKTTATIPMAIPAFAPADREGADIGVADGIEVVVFDCGAAVPELVLVLDVVVAVVVLFPTPPPPSFPLESAQ